MSADPALPTPDREAMEEGLASRYGTTDGVLRPVIAAYKAGFRDGAAYASLAGQTEQLRGPAKMLDGANRAALKLAGEVEQLREALGEIARLPNRGSRKQLLVIARTALAASPEPESEDHGTA